ncbi:hypothetical protein [Aquimarina algicola]|uniref:Uncharacterized protein n=1 Tax=Aquimarina algicola TaxID=2589995 RepID=A0A504J304_9FLAO|nr:hypothetical protein [Aquimarina algicola]TPN82378.1 hypothetical protein FHK87_23445 [Aquimarina algicola]
MKKILELSGTQKLTKEQQQNIKGAANSVSCCPSGNGCLISSTGDEFVCVPGRCFGSSKCILA